MIVLEPLGGLCNRLRTMASAQALAEVVGQKIWLLWRRDATLNCAFEDLFETPAEVTRILELEGRTAIRFADLLTFLICDFRWDENDVLGCIEEGFDFTQVGRYRRPMLRTAEMFWSSTCFTAFRPVAALQTTIERYVSSFDDTIGLHLRRTDNTRAREASPTELFMGAMEQETEQNPAVRFFLATDEPEEEILLQRRFGDRLIVHPKPSRRRDDPQAIRDAVIDLYCLAGCRRIYGSYWSSFSEVAQQLGSAELRILQSAADDRS